MCHELHTRYTCGRVLKTGYIPDPSNPLCDYNNRDRDTGVNVDGANNTDPDDDDDDAGTTGSEIEIQRPNPCIMTTRMDDTTSSTFRTGGQRVVTRQVAGKCPACREVEEAGEKEMERSEDERMRARMEWWWVVDRGGETARELVRKDGADEAAAEMGGNCAGTVEEVMEGGENGGKGECLRGEAGDVEDDGVEVRTMKRTVCRKYAASDVGYDVSDACCVQ